MSILNSNKKEQNLELDSISSEHENNKNEEEINKEINEEFIYSEIEWVAQYEEIVGLAHRKSKIPIPCQDYALSSCSPRPFVIIADGAGSSAVSDIGSKSVVIGLSRLIHTLENQQISDCLDYKTDEKKIKSLSFLLIKHAKGILEDLSLEHRREIRDFRCTLLLGIVGKINTLWIKVGDGAIVVEKRLKNQDLLLEYLGDLGKGEFANETIFLDYLNFSDIQIGVIPSKEVVSLIAMSDGTAEKLISQKDKSISGRISLLTKELRENNLSRHKLTKLFYSEEFMNRHSGDDCSIAIISGKNK